MLEGHDRKARKANRVVTEALRLEALCNDLLDFARSSEPNRTSTDPRALLRDAAEAVSSDIAVDTARAPERWSIDPLRMRQALENILRNAAQASPDGVPPRARVATEGKHLVFEITDRGPGIAEDEVDIIFEPFHTKRIRGTGLGLAVTRRIVQQHDGRITASNRPDGGACFRIELPSASPA